MQLARDRGSDGHKTLSDIERYTRAASQEALNASPIEKQAANKQVACRSELATPLTNKDKLSRVAVPRGVEPPTFGLGNRCSILLSYGTIRDDVAQAWV